MRIVGKLFVVDLAGSEVVRKTAATGKRLDEAKYINKVLGNLVVFLMLFLFAWCTKSLTALGLVINALTDGKSKHIPYRDSKLTRLLQEETLSTIRFGSRAQHIQNAPHVNAEKSTSDYKQLVADMERKVEALSQYIAQLTTSPVTPTICDRFEITRLKQSLHLMKQERDDAAQRATVDKHLFDFADQKKSDIHRYAIHSSQVEPSLQHGVVCDNVNLIFLRVVSQLESTIASQDQRIQGLLQQQELWQRQVQDANQRCQATQHELAAVQRSNQLATDQNQAELDIVRRALESYERDHQRLQGQVHDLQKRLAASDARSQEHLDQLEECRAILARKDEDPSRLHRGVGHSQSFPMLVKPALSPPKLPLRPVTVVGCSSSIDDPRLQLQSRGNIQQWWSGPQDVSVMATPVCTKVPHDEQLVHHNNLADDVVPSGDTKTPFKARLVGLLASLQEETDAFKDLGDKINQEHTRQKTRQKTRRSRRLLPDLQTSDEFSDSVTGPQR
ncbi:hypothetical protein DYB26_000519 [Aphanomyces astaci]|uniref:Kinesin-like protein n=1 Tax=Aphanomyces astaci TaxID=112090 RepID=A0A397ATB1_APHAT|nr:hypothetical protein DYB36_000496 [Aphanomyces astaci]RHY65148.1 hypothetical protein DYB34_000421 [Aphanomyces astaci]RHZ09586.1 hypothetical protein DYB31_000815 [Aphanomyces astaci]RHZ23128.1 hypothetical protein DYB26_000519 [Aphanomyces astaci]